jgi:hypothetical protein
VSFTGGASGADVVGLGWVGWVGGAMFAGGVVGGADPEIVGTAGLLAPSSTP